MHRYEVKLDKLLIGHPGLKTIPRICDSLAFEKGVEYFTELVFFYGILFTIMFIEMYHFEASREETENLISDVGQR